MISLSDLVTVSPVRSVAKVSNQQSNRPERSTSRGRDRDHLTAQQEFCCPQAGTQLSVNKDSSLSASKPSVGITRSGERVVIAGDLRWEGNVSSRRWSSWPDLVLTH